MSEHDQTSAVVKWFKAKYPKYKDCIIGLGNGAVLGGNSRLRGIRMNSLKAEGFKPGASDLFIAVPRGDKHGLWVEMKDVKKTLCSVSEAQRAHLDLMSEMGYEAIWCAGFDVAKAAIEVYMNTGKSN